jgi:hypothetical protein
VADARVAAVNEAKLVKVSWRSILPANNLAPRYFN